MDGKKEEVVGKRERGVMGGEEGCGGECRERKVIGGEEGSGWKGAEGK